MERERDPFYRIMQWYYAHCDGDWEHDEGILIGTLDNPGWYLKINLEGTELEAKPFTEISQLEHEIEWHRCWVENKKFHGAGGPMMMIIIMEAFLDWAYSDYTELESDENNMK
ncbi:MAG: hypothetical protein BroJett015_47700 [Chloroflexota bacterium]|nr:MAG: hypothetical protein BroJett015_47700 [Chloroflexota bacterium]